MYTLQCIHYNIYPSPTHSICKDTLVGVCVSVLALNRLIHVQYVSFQDDAAFHCPVHM